MAAWAKIKFFWETMLGSTGSTLTATSTASGYDAKNIYDMLETTMWKGAGSLANTSFETWSGGPSVAPDNWTLFGNGGVARDGANQYSGTYCAAITFGSGTPTYLEQEFMDWARLKGGKLTIKCRVKSSLANHAKIVLYDGVGSAESAFHTGGVTYEQLTATRDIDANATTVSIRLQVHATGTAYFDMASFAIYINYDAGAGNTKTADYFAMCGHNLGSIVESLVRLEASNDVNFGGAFTAVHPADDKTFLTEFPNPGVYRYWRIVIDGLTSTPPYIAICIWGLKTELDYASASYDPDEQEAKANVNVSDTGYLLGIHRRYTERSMTLRFEDADSALYAKIRDWWETSGLKNFFVAVDTANRPNDVFLMRPDPKFSNPLKAGGLYRDIALSLKGRKE